jgi:acetyl-CoA carboxylase/biotin carboxylase 1
LPESLADSPKKIVFIGPPGSAMRSLGDKISSTIVAQHAKVPCIPWSGTGIDEVKVGRDGIVTVEDHVYTKGCTKSPEEGLLAAKRIGFPVMVKASEGGGGKGIRKVEREEDFIELYKAAALEIPGSPIFIMKMAGNARHLEVQLLADQYGNNISLFGRDCSVQRRHQKIIEEAPVTIANSHTFEKMERAAVSLGKLVGYVSAGTVEYLYSHEEDKFYFLELNPRLQVEHPTTEMVSGVNLPAAQLQIAMGLPLHCIRDIRLLYGVDHKLDTPIDFEFSTPESLEYQRKPMPKGHTTACRITSEDPGQGFKPSSGTMEDLNFRSSSNVWGYFSVSANSSIHSFSDSQFGHIFAYGENRGASRKHMVVALKELSIRGSFKTTIEYLIKLLETPAFEDNTITTSWLDELISKKLTAERPNPMIAVVCGAVAKAHIASDICMTEYRLSLEKGQVMSKDSLKTDFQVDFIYDGERYRVRATRISADAYRLYMNGTHCVVGTRGLSDGGLLVLLDGKAHTVYWKEEVGATRLSIDSKTCLLEQENDPTQLRTPSPGKLVKFSVENGAHVRKGQSYAEVEVMKMYMPLVAQEDGRVQFMRQPGATLEAGDVLGMLALDDPSKVKSATLFTGTFPEFGLPQVIGRKAPQQFDYLDGVMKNVLAGYDNSWELPTIFKELVGVLRDPELPYGQWNSQASALHARMPNKLDELLSQIVLRAAQRKLEFPSKTLQKSFYKFLDEMPAAEASLLKSGLAPLVEVMERYNDGLKAHEYSIMVGYLRQYYEVEKLFATRTPRDEEVILRLRDEHRDDIITVVRTVLSHTRISSKNKLALAVLEAYRPDAPGAASSAKAFRPILKNLCELEGRFTSPVALKAREVLIQCAMPSLSERTSQMEHILRSAVLQHKYGESGWEHREPDYDVLKEVVDSRYTVFDVLPLFFGHEDPYVVLAALEVYIRRVYRAYTLKTIEYHGRDEDEPPFVLSWDFSLRKVSEGQFGLPIEPSFPSTPATPVPGDHPGAVSKRIRSISDMSFFNSKGTGSDSDVSRKGVIVPVNFIDDAESLLQKALDALPIAPPKRPTGLALMSELSGRRKPSTPMTEVPEDELDCVMDVAVRDAETLVDSEILERIQTIIDLYRDEFKLRRVRRLTFVCGHKDGTYPGYYTFRAPDFIEDPDIRHIEPALAFQLELHRLSKFRIQPKFTQNRNVHIYYAVGKGMETDRRYFVRSVVRASKIREDISIADYAIAETDRIMGDTLDALEVLDNKSTDMNHIFINFSQPLPLDYPEVVDKLEGFVARFGFRSWRLRVNTVEVRLIVTDTATGRQYPLRIVVNNPSGFMANIEIYEESKGAHGDWIFKSLGDGPKAAMHLLPVGTPYPTKGALQPKRHAAHVLGTQYVYDFPELFRQAIEKSWVAAMKKDPKLKELQPRTSAQMVTYAELVPGENGRKLVEVNRELGINTIGMVGWMVTARTPEYPAGRQFVIVANDVTFKIGSFGPEEDEFFHRCSELARAKGIPRIYLSANSGARLGVADDIMPHFEVAWKDEKVPEKGFKYLYLTPEKKKRFEDGNRRDVITEEVREGKEIRHKLVTVIGGSEGLGVESLRGSGLIAGATSRAYEDIFTITLVTCRSVGIGAYLVRLGQRAIQVEGQPIILTGAQALNNVLGRQVYSSNLQLGGTQIMYRNGVSHMVARDDFDGVERIVKWLSYVPRIVGGSLPVMPNFQDSWDRDIVYRPPLKQAYDVRWMIGGKQDDETFLSGLFDRDSFEEALGGWAKTVVVGRARLGGIPVGVIGVEARAIENVSPADPANPDSIEQVTAEAGGVWYPNSAFKTAQAINDFNHGERLPLIMLANWRGFSGGQRDMYNEVLKYGSYIVDALVKYRQPVLVYIPPHGELRGGSWVVVDPTINPAYMEMYADDDARGGVLEPEGIVGIKYKLPKLQATMERTDETYAELKRALDAASKKCAVDDETQDEDDITRKKRQLENKRLLDGLKAKLLQREQTLLPVYTQLALQFADLHDRAGRMAAKGVIRQALQWKNARRFLYWRLRRRLAEEQVLERMERATGKVERPVPDSTNPSPADQLFVPEASTSVPPTPTSPEAVAAAAVAGLKSPTNITKPAIGSVAVDPNHVEVGGRPNDAAEHNITDPQLEDRAKRLAHIKAWCAGAIEQFDTSDKAVAEWIEKNGDVIEKKIEGLKTESIKDKVMALLAAEGSSSAAWEAVKAAVGMMGARERDGFVKGL